MENGINGIIGNSYSSYMQLLRPSKNICHADNLLDFENITKRVEMFVTMSTDDSLDLAIELNTLIIGLYEEISELFEQGEYSHRDILVDHFEDYKKSFTNIELLRSLKGEKQSRISYRYSDIYSLLFEQCEN